LLSIVGLCGNYEIVDFLLNSKSDPTIKDKFGFDVLYTAARRGFFDCVKVSCYFLF
jgi:ankyrin repeat protein